jgi:hypothetical protein
MEEGQLATLAFFDPLAPSQSIPSPSIICHSSFTYRVAQTLRSLHDAR